jgi:hypothetical protein
MYSCMCVWRRVCAVSIVCSRCRPLVTAPGLGECHHGVHVRDEAAWRGWHRWVPGAVGPAAAGAVRRSWHIGASRAGRRGATMAEVLPVFVVPKVLRQTPIAQ